MKAYANAGLSRDFPAPTRFDDEFLADRRDEAIADKADELCSDWECVQETVSEGIKLDRQTAEMLAAWFDCPGSVNSEEIVRGISDAIYTASLIYAENELEG